MGLGQRLSAGLDWYRGWRMARSTGPLANFHRNGGNRLLVENLPVTSDELVFDVGGFHGDWTAELQSRYGCRSVVFEPVPEFQRILSGRFAKNQRVQLVDAGLDSHTGRTSLWLAGDGSSVLRATGGASVKVDMLGVAEAFVSFADTQPIVACMKLNVEGAEYAVLETMLAAGLAGRVKCFLIQFHEVATTSRSRRFELQRRLSTSHRCDFDYPFVWEKWTARI